MAGLFRLPRVAGRVEARRSGKGDPCGAHPHSSPTWAPVCGKFGNVKTPPLFDERRAAQSAAYLLSRAGGRMSLLALTKLLYLAERESFKRYAEPLTGDTPVSMKHGPVLSNTLDLMNGFSKTEADDGWDRWIAERDGRMIELRDPAMLTDFERDLPALSRADFDVLADTWGEFGAMHTDPWALVRYCHVHCPEWEDPGLSSFEIPIVRLLRAVGYDEAAVEAAREQLDDRAELQRAFG